MDLQIGPRTAVGDLQKMERTVAHPLTGPVYVKDAKGYRTSGGAGTLCPVAPIF
jgi:hypothetical protein